MKKVFLSLSIALSLVLLTSFNSTASASVSANLPIGVGTTGKLPEKYYANGLYCNQFTCRVDWNQARQSIGEISYRGWMNGLPKLGTGGF